MFLEVFFTSCTNGNGDEYSTVYLVLLIDWWCHYSSTLRKPWTL